MSEVEQVNQRCLDLKLELLGCHRGHIHHTVDEFVNNIMSLAKQWTDNQEGKPQIYDLLQAIDKAVELLDLKCEEISEIDKNVLKNCKENATKQIDVDRMHNQKSSPEIDKDMEHITFQSEMLKWCKKQEKRLYTNEEEVKALNAKLTKVGKAQKEIKNMKEQLEKLSENQNILQDQIRITEATEEQFKDLSNEIEYLKHRVMVAKDKNDPFMENVLTRTYSLEKAATELSEQISRSEESIETILTEQKRCAVEIEDITRKLVVVEERDGKFDNLQKQFEEVDEKHKMVCQMLVTRLKPLEQLQQTLNGKCRTRDENITTLQELVKEVAVMSPRIAQLELQHSKPVGFTAGKSDVETIARNYAINFYQSVYCNVGSHFDRLTGVFTVPYDGTYVVSVTLMNYDYENILEVNLICNDALVSNGKERIVCWAVSGPVEARYCDLGLIEMKTGDTLFAKVGDQCSNNECKGTCNIRISCFMIG